MVHELTCVTEYPVANSALIVSLIFIPYLIEDAELIIVITRRSRVPSVIVS